MKNGEGIRWDLSDLFSGHDDPRIDQTLAEVKSTAEAFCSRYQGTIRENNDAEWMRKVILELESIHAQLAGITSFASLLYAANTMSREAKDLEQKVQQKTTEIGNLLLFFEIEWLEASEEGSQALMKDPALADYRHFLQASRRYRRHKLSLAEEKIVNEKDNSGRRAFGRLFTELTSALSFPIELDGRQQNLPMSEILALLHKPVREWRERAYQALFDVLSSHGLVLSSIYDTVIQDHLTMDRLRNYNHPMEERHLSNEVAPEAVNQMMEAAESNYGLAQDYFRFKAHLLGLDKLALFDQYAPVGIHPPPCDFSAAREIILQAFGQFYRTYGEMASKFFEKEWIDAEVRTGKSEGAFSLSPSPKHHPYILCNYTDQLNDVMTVAHELGHGLHGLLSRKQSLLNYHPPLTTAETASVFAEMLVFDHLVNLEKDPRIELSVLCGKIEDIFATVFRQNVMTRFEEAVFCRRCDGRLSEDNLGQIWMETNRRYYGDAVDLPESYRWGWSYIPHFIHSRFYCYSYVFGELLVLSLYRLYREQREAFVPKYTALLEAGGSEDPETLLSRLGINVRDRGFWQKGFLEIERLIGRAREISGRISIEPRTWA